MGLSLALHAAIALPVFRWVTTPMTPSEPARPVSPSSSGALDPCAPLRLDVTRQNNARFGPDGARHRIDLFHPHAGQAGGPWPALLIFTDDAPDADGVDALRRAPPLALRLAQRGYVVAVVQATTPTGQRLSAAEGKLALRWLKRQTKALALNPAAVGVLGGRLAGLVGLGHGPNLGDVFPAWLDDGGRPAALAVAALPGDPASRALDATLSGCATPEPCTDCDVPLCSDCAPEWRAHADALDPPTLVTAGSADCAVPQRHAQRLVEALNEVGVTAQWQLVAGVVRPDDLTRTPTRMAEVETFFDAELRGCRPAPAPVPLLADTDVARLLSTRTPTPPKPKPEEKKPEEKKPEVQPKGQVVEIPPPRDRTRPENARFLSEYDSSVEKEQVSRRNEAPTPRVIKSKLRKMGKGDERAGDAPKKPVVRPKKKQRTRKQIAKQPGDAPTKGDKASPQPTPRPVVTKAERKDDPAAKLAPGEGPFAAEQPAADPTKVQPAGGGTPGGAAAPDDWRKLLPSLGPEELVRQDGSIDHVEDVDKGDGTFLNTAEYKHAWFFNRVKRAVQQRWRAVDAHRRYDPYGRVYGVRDRLTVLQVTLNPDGTLDDVFVAEDSGVAFLDDAALKAFREAQPFPNPPDALRGADGRIRFKFSFFLEIGGRGMRMFRGPPR